MSMQTQKIIEGLGYSANEAKVYVAALALGECHVTDLAKKVRLPRSTTQTIADKLHKDGLLNFYVRKRYKYWVAERPVHLLNMLQAKEETVRMILPHLESLRHADKVQTHTKILQGVEEVRLIFEEMLEVRKNILTINPWDNWVALVGRGFMEDFVEHRTKHFLHMRMLTMRTPLSITLKSADSHELRTTRFLPSDVAINTTIFIYGDTVALVSLNNKLPTAVVMDDPDIRHTMELFFEELWARSAA